MSARLSGHLSSRHTRARFRARRVSGRAGAPLQAVPSLGAAGACQPFLASPRMGACKSRFAAHCWAVSLPFRTPFFLRSGCSAGGMRAPLGSDERGPGRQKGVEGQRWSGTTASGPLSPSEVRRRDALVMKLFKRRQGPRCRGGARAVRLRRPLRRGDGEHLPMRPNRAAARGAECLPGAGRDRVGTSHVRYRQISGQT